MEFFSEKKMSRSELEHDRLAYMQSNIDTRFAMDKKYDYICVWDKYAENGMLDNQYFVQDIWGARKVFEHKPEVHYDVGSSVAGFVAHLLSMKQKVKLIDIRPMENNLDTLFLNSGGGVIYHQSDATHLDNIESQSIQSLSALCSVEHFGLGRYGDPIDPMAWEKALKSFQRVLASGGRLYFSVPIGRINKVCFNAHRVYTPQIIIDTLNDMDIIEMSYVNGFDTVTCIERIDDVVYTCEKNLDSIPDILNNGTTGLFEFRKK